MSQMYPTSCHVSCHMLCHHLLCHVICHLFCTTCFDIPSKPGTLDTPISGTVWCTCHDHVSVTPCCVFHVACFCYTCLYRALCFVVENVFHALHHLRTCMSCLSSVFCACIGVVFMSHVIHLLCYIYVMLHALHRCVFIPQNDPISPHWPFLTLFGVLKKTMLPFGHPQKYPVFSVEGSPTLWHRAPKHPQNRPKMTPK